MTRRHEETPEAVLDILWRKNWLTIGGVLALAVWVLVMKIAEARSALVVGQLFLFGWAGAALVTAYGLHRRDKRRDTFEAQRAAARARASTLYVTVQTVTGEGFVFHSERGRGAAIGPFEFAGDATDVLPGDVVTINGHCKTELIDVSSEGAYRGLGRGLVFRTTPECPVLITRYSWR